MDDLKDELIAELRRANTDLRVANTDLRKRLDHAHYVLKHGKAPTARSGRADARRVKLTPDGTVATMLKDCEGKIMHRILGRCAATLGEPVERSALVGAEASSYRARTGKTADPAATAHAVGMAIAHAKRHAERHGFRLAVSKTGEKLKLTKMALDADEKAA